ncbi:MAG: L-threonylcarbamoyladenylate synthase [Tissierellia bacterium]|nr:L-threonylcarbamoyladenylate synthase [Tissierellia bacterium]
MKTKVFKIDRENLSKELLEKASSYILNDGLVAMPTETVYGLSANGLSDNACHKIFKAKNRPSDNPLILHISKLEQLYSLVEDIPEDINDLMKNLWPGPMTLIFKKSKLIPDTVCAKGDTVAIRMPEDIIAREFITMCNKPLAAPSANISGRPSPTNAEDVYYDMNGKIDAIIDGGNCKIGIESTVIDVSQKPYTILRPGFYTYEFLKTYIEDIKLDDSLVDPNKIPKSPGQKYKHYAPKAKMEVYVGQSAISKIKNILENTDKKVGLLLFDDAIDQFKDYEVISLGDRNDLLQMSHRLFTALRILDRKNVDLILAEGVYDKELGKSIMNRMKKSASGNVHYL